MKKLSKQEIMEAWFIDNQIHLLREVIFEGQEYAEVNEFDTQYFVKLMCWIVNVTLQSNACKFKSLLKSYVEDDPELHAHLSDHAIDFYCKYYKGDRCIKKWDTIKIMEEEVFRYKIKGKYINYKKKGKKK